MNLDKKNIDLFLLLISLFFYVFFSLFVCMIKPVFLIYELNVELLARPVFIYEYYYLDLGNP